MDKVIGKWLSVQVVMARPSVLGSRPTDDVEVHPPEPETEHEGDHSRCDRRDVLLRDGQAIHDTEDDLAEDDDREQPEALDERIRGRDAPAQADPRAPADQQDAQDPGDGETCPDHQPWLGREEGAPEDHHNRHDPALHVASGDRQELGPRLAVLAVLAGPCTRARS